MSLFPLEIWTSCVYTFFTLLARGTKMMVLKRNPCGFILSSWQFAHFIHDVEIYDSNTMQLWYSYKVVGWCARIYMHAHDGGREKLPWWSISPLYSLPKRGEDLCLCPHFSKCCWLGNTTFEHLYPYNTHICLVLPKWSCPLPFEKLQPLLLLLHPSFVLIQCWT